MSAVPDDIPCREVEFYTICDFVKGQLSTGNGGCMFVSGVPGTGKTATIRAVARTLQAERDAGEVVPFQFIELNGMALTSPQHVYGSSRSHYRGVSLYGK